MNDKAEAYVKEVEKALRGVVLDEPIKNNQLRFEIDRTDDSLGKKIKRATAMKIPVVLIVGEKDAEAREVSVRTRDGEEKVGLDELVGWLVARSEV